MAAWKAFHNMKHISGAASKSKAQNYGNYIMRDKECVAVYKEDRILTDRKEINNERRQNKEKWQRSLDMEKRQNSRLQTRAVVPIPNYLTQAQKIKLAENLRNHITDNGKRNVNLDLVEHRGVKNGIENRHFHIIWNDRDLTTGEKIREFQDKKFLKGINSTIEKTLQDEKIQVARNVSDNKRERINFNDYEVLQKKGENAPEIRNNQKVKRYIEQKRAKEEEKQIRAELREVQAAKNTYLERIQAQRGGKKSVQDQRKENFAKQRQEQKKQEPELSPVFKKLQERIEAKGDKPKSFAQQRQEQKKGQNFAEQRSEQKKGKDHQEIKPKSKGKEKSRE
jgi:hypothetical protein